MTFLKTRAKSIFSEIHFYKKALLFIIPICLQSVVETILGLMNTFLVGQFGNDGLVAGVASSSNIYDMAWFGFFAIVATGNIFFSQYSGSGNKQKIKETTNIKLFYALIMSVLFIVVLQLFSKQISQLMLGYNKPEAVKTATHYNRLISWNYPLLGFAYIMSITINATGNVKVPLLVSSVSLVLNTTLAVTLSLPLKGLPGLGIDGLAIALIVSRLVECLIFIVYLIRKKPEYAPNLNIFRFSKNLNIAYLKAFIPMFLNQILFAFSLIIQTVIFAYYGNASVIAAASVTGTTMAIFYSTFRGYTALVSYYVGQRLGEGKLELAKENATKILHLCLAISFFFSLIILSLAFWWPEVLFSKLTITAQNLATWYLAFNAITFFAINMLQPLFSFLYAGGYTLIVSIVDLSMIWFVDIFITFALLQWGHLDIKYVMMISCITKIIDFAGAYLLYKVVPWNKKIVDNNKIKTPMPIID